MSLNGPEIVLFSIPLPYLTFSKCMKCQLSDFAEEACSTSIFSADESPLLCPHGYVCHIDYFGDPQKNIPNRGRCIKNHVLLTRTFSFLQSQHRLHEYNRPRPSFRNILSQFL